MSPAIISILIVVVLAVFFIWDKFPVAWVALAGAIIMGLLGYITQAQVFSGMASSNPVLLGSMMIVGGACFRTGLARKMADMMIKVTGRSEGGILLALMIVSGLFSTICSNVGTIVTMLPIIMSICKETRVSPSRIIMPVGYAICAGGVVTLVGTGSSPACNSALEGLGMEGFGFLDFAVIGIPLTILTILFFATIGRRMIPDRSIDEYDLSKIEEGSGDKVKMTITAVVLIAVVAVMAINPSGIKLYMTSSIGAAILIFTGCISEKQAYQSISWPTVFLAGAMIAVGNGLTNAGGGQLIADFCKKLLSNNPSPYLIITVIFIATTLLSQFMSNVSVGTLMIPIAVYIAQGINCNPMTMAMVVAFGCNAAFMTPIGTPAFVIACDEGKYKFMDFVKCGLPITIINYILVLILTPIFWQF